MSKDPLCKRCGRCCKEAGGGALQATYRDIARWRKQRTQDILAYTDAEFYQFHHADLWFDPVTGEELDYCPFLRKVGRKKYECTIYETRPEQCRDWSCVLCYGSTSFKEGETVTVGAWNMYKISNLEVCPECQKRGICKRHNFVSLQWLTNYVRKA